jgi:hypothetical protein
MPAVKTEIVLAAEDADLTKWLSDRGIRCRQFTAAERAEREELSGNPVAERLLRNLLNYAASQPKPKGLTP